MKARDIIVIGTSAGGITALKTLLKQFPLDLPATAFIVQHMSSSHLENTLRDAWRSGVENVTLLKAINNQQPAETADQLTLDLRKAEERVRRIQQVLNLGAKVIS